MTPGLRILAATFILLALGRDAPADDPAPPSGASPPAAAQKTDKPPRVLVTISKETTYITEPLRKDGYVDYVAALNARYSKGVTPENNAAVLFWKAVGPAQIEAASREEFFKTLGITPPPAQGDYFVPFDAYVAEQRKLLTVAGVEPNEKEIAAAKEIVTLGTVRPWSRKELPTLADWLKANKKPLDIAIEASKRPRRFDPIIVSDIESPLLFPTQELNPYKEVALALIARALLQIDSGELEKAWENLLAAHRLARLVGQGPTLLESLMAMTIDQIADIGDQALLQHSLPTSAQAMIMLDDLRGLPPFPELARVFDGTERFVYLGALACLARGHSKEMAKMMGGKGGIPAVPPGIDRSNLPSVDWDYVLRAGNEWYDLMSKALRQPTRGSRKEAWRGITRDFNVKIRKLTDKPALALDALFNLREGISARVGAALLARLMSDGEMAANAEDRVTMRFEITKLGFAMAAFHADHGSHPATLAELVPKYVPKIPKDIFNDSDLHYKLKLKRESYVIYSVGPNGKDDGGKGEDDAKNVESWDDIALAVPGPEKAKPKP